MAIDFESVKQSLVSAGREVGDKAKEASQIATLKLDIRTKEDFLEKQYAELGRMYYVNHREDDVPEKESFGPIQEAIEEIARLNDELLNVQGSVLCPGCGIRQSKDHTFCDRCGAKLV